MTHDADECGIRGERVGHVAALGRVALVVARNADERDAGSLGGVARVRLLDGKLGTALHALAESHGARGQRGPNTDFDLNSRLRLAGRAGVARAATATGSDQRDKDKRRDEREKPPLSQLHLPPLCSGLRMSSCYMRSDSVPPPRDGESDEA